MCLDTACDSSLSESESKYTGCHRLPCYRYNFRMKNGFDDGQRTDIALMGAVGKRLTYQRTSLI